MLANGPERAQGPGRTAPPRHLSCADIVNTAFAVFPGLQDPFPCEHAVSLNRGLREVGLLGEPGKVSYLEPRYLVAGTAMPSSSALCNTPRPNFGSSLELLIFRTHLTKPGTSFY